MSVSNWIKKIFVLHVLILVSCVCLANESLFQQARTFQREGKYGDAVEAYKRCLLEPMADGHITDQQLFVYTEALTQLMNSFQSMGEPEACVATMQEVFAASPVLQEQCLRDYYSVMGYALSRTERMSEAEDLMMKALALPLFKATPERYFRDYAYAAAVFYSNPNYQDEVINWCQEALAQAELCGNTSGVQWVKAMLGSLYKKNGHLHDAIELFHQSKEEARLRGDDLGVLNSLHSLIDLFLYWDIPEYANLYASEAIRVERSMSMKNPMVSVQTYINKGRALQRLGELDSVAMYTEHAREICKTLPYNSGMVDVHLLHGGILSEKGGDSLRLGIQELQQVTMQGTHLNRAKAYHKLAHAYLRSNENNLADSALDSLYTLLNGGDTPIYINIDYEPILRYYLKKGERDKADLYMSMMLQEQQTFKEKRLNLNLVESIIDLQSEQKMQDLKISELKEANQRLWILICVIVYVITISVIVVLLLRQKRYHVTQMKIADERFASLVQELNESNVEKEKIALEIKEFLKDNDNRKELETLTPFILKDDGETKFRQCFELLYPLFLPRLRDKVPSITRREELLSMLIVLKQDNREIAELLAIAPRSVLMLRHRFRQKIGMATELSLENFIEGILGVQSDVMFESNSESKADNSMS